MLRYSAVLLATVHAFAAFAGEPEWRRFVERHVAAEGRVIDDGAGGISHSEGQGVVMLLAVHHDDRRTFERVYRWTRNALDVRDDGLLAWRWLPGHGVTDRNNAADGDLFVAWALARASRRWEASEYRDAAAAAARAIRQRLLRRTARGLVLLPGAEGFEKPDHLVINLSYWLFPAFRELGTVDPDPAWSELERTGLLLLDTARFGRWGLPPDWLRLADSLAPEESYPPRFGYDAVRIPLHLMWVGQDSDHRLAPFRNFWRYFESARFLPAWTDLKNDSVDSYHALPGILAIVRASGGNSAPPPLSDRSEPYYSAALVLLTEMMQWERGKP